LSCGHWDHTVKVHSLDGMRVKSSESGGHRGPIRCLSVTDDGSLMITGGQDATCRVWVVDHPDMAVALLDGYVQTALGTDGSKEKILSCCHVLWGHETPITCLAVSSDLDVAISGSMDGIICVHSVRRGKFVRSICVDDFYLKEVSLRRHNQEQTPVRKLALDRNGRNGTFVAHLENGMLQMYTVNGVRLCCTDAGEKLHAMEICSGGEMLVTGGESCHVVIRTLSDLGVRCVLDLSRHGPIRCISFTPVDLNPSPQFMYIGTDDGRITIVDSDALHDTKANEERPKWILHESGTTSIMSGHEQNKKK
jgi:WD40 repeat protein